MKLYLGKGDVHSHIHRENGVETPYFLIHLKQLHDAQKEIS